MPSSSWTKFRAGFGHRASVKTVLDDELPGLILEFAELVETVRSISNVRARLYDGTLTALRGASAKVTQDLEDAGDSQTKKDEAIDAYKAIADAAKGHVAQAKLFIKEHLADLDVAGNVNAQKAIDRMVLDDVEWSKATDEQKEEAMALLKKRFGLGEDGLEGKWGKKAIPQMYRLLKMLPEGHTTTNPSLKTIKREVPGPIDHYIMGKKAGLEGGGVITVTARVVHQIRPTLSLGQDEDIEDGYEMDQTKLQPFDHLTLHEVGHTVDSKLKFMESKRNNDAFGGWSDKLSIEALVPLIVAHNFGSGTFAALTSTEPAQARDAVISASLSGNDPVEAVETLVKGEANSVTLIPSAPQMLQLQCLIDAQALRTTYQATGWPTDSTVPDHIARLKGEVFDSVHAVFGADRRAMKKQMGEAATKQAVAFEFCPEIIEAILKEDGGQDFSGPMAMDFLPKPSPMHGYDHDKAKAWLDHPAIAFCKKFAALRAKGTCYDATAAKELALGDRVIGVSVGAHNPIYTYAKAARRRMVSRYQFNAPPEWFAEIYALYYQDRLPDGHAGAAMVESLRAR